MTENKNNQRRGENPKPRNEPTEPKEVSGSPRPTTGQSGQAGQQQPRPKSGSEKVGSAATPRTGSTTGSGTPAGGNGETRGSARNASDEPGMPKRTGPGRSSDR